MSDDAAERHRARMARRKARVDADIAAAQQDKGLLLVLTGPGKGKSSSAFGMLARALGHGQKAAVVQFIKGRSDTGEEAFFRDQAGVDWQVCGEGFTWETQSRERDVAAARAGWAVAARSLADPAVNLLVLDELTYLFSYGYLDLATALADIAARPPMQHVVITGRAAPQALIEAADTVSDIGDLKHAFRAGVRAQPGIDW
ncbi:cob(I)yrinic acid a,c-diamide adenosyltransferase [Immundisolibacter sp.]